MHISPRLSIFVLTIYNRKSAEVIGYLRGPFIISLLSCSTRKTCVGSICILKFRKAGINSSRVMHLLICSTLRLKSASFFTPSLIFLAALEISLFMIFLYYKYYTMKPGHKRFRSTTSINLTQCSCASISALYSMISQTRSWGRSDSIFISAR